MTPQDEGPVAYPMPPADAGGGAHARPEQSHVGAAGGQSAAANENSSATLLSEESAANFRSRWEAIQHGFVDEPRGSMADADTLVGEVMERLAATFEAQRGSLENQWEQGEPSTEELREAFRRYRNFFERLLTV